MSPSPSSPPFAVTIARLQETKWSRMAAGSWSVCVIRRDAKLECWGRNTNGELGLGTQTSHVSPTNSRPSSNIVDLGTGAVPVQVAKGKSFTCVLLEVGEVKCFGARTYALGRGDGISSGRIGDEPSDMGDNLLAVDLGTGVKAVKLCSATYEQEYFCVITQNGRVKCWGEGGQGQLGYGDRVYRGVSPSTMGDNLPYVDLGTSVGRVVDLACGHQSATCAMFESGKLKCWGRNDYGTTGSGSTETIGDDPNEMGDHLPYVDLGTGNLVRSVNCGRYQCCAQMRDSLKRKCWGYNYHGELGYGTTGHIGNAPNQMGNNLAFINDGVGKHAVSWSFGYHAHCYVDNVGDVRCFAHCDAQACGSHPNSGWTDSNKVYRVPAGDAMITPMGTGVKALEVKAYGYGFCALLDNDGIKCWGNCQDNVCGHGPFGWSGIQNRFGDNLVYTACVSGWEGTCP